MHALPRIVSTLSLAIVAIGHGCNRGETGASATSSATAAVVASGGAVEFTLEPAGPSYADEDLAVPADFEAEAEREISPENYRDELEALARELDASVPDAATRRASDGGTRSEAPPGPREGRGPARPGQTDR